MQLFKATKSIAFLNPSNPQKTIKTIEIPAQALIRRWYRGENTLMLVADSFQSFDDIIVGSDTTVRVVGTVVWMQSASEIDL